MIKITVALPVILIGHPTKEKQLTNISAARADESIILTPTIQMRLERALEFIEDD